MSLPVCPVVNASRQCTINLLYPRQKAGSHFFNNKTQHGTRLQNNVIMKRFPQGGPHVILSNVKCGKKGLGRERERVVGTGKGPDKCQHSCRM